MRENTRKKLKSVGGVETWNLSSAFIRQSFILNSSCRWLNWCVAGVFSELWFNSVIVTTKRKSIFTSYWCADRLYVEDKKNENKCSSVFSFVLAKERTLCIAHVRVFAESWINVLKYWICPWPIKYAATFALWSSCSGLPKAWLLLSYQIRWIGNKTLAVIKLLNSC